MNAYAKYLVQKLKDIDKDCSKIVIVPCYVDRTGKTNWCKDDILANSKKCILFGYESHISNAKFLSSSSTRTWGSAFKFQYDWQDDFRKSLSTDDASGNALCESIFVQCMALSEQQNIYIDKKLLFAKGSACEHMMMAELTA